MDEVSSQEMEKKDGTRLGSIRFSRYPERILKSENSPLFVHRIDASDSWQ
jgi:hypothetical protein